MTKQQIKRQITFLQSIIDKFISTGRKATRGLKKWLLSIIEKIDRLQAMLDNMMDVTTDTSINKVQKLQTILATNAQSNEQLSFLELLNLQN